MTATATGKLAIIVEQNGLPIWCAEVFTMRLPAGREWMLPLGEGGLVVRLSVPRPADLLAAPFGVGCPDCGAPDRQIGRP